MNTPAVQDATLELLIGVNRMLDQAEEVRSLRDRLLTLARDSQPRTAPPAGDAEVPHVARN